ncbi:hypothetical protein DYH09_35140 [bacterium CPR1]|nr:hypothetical protein [bacterium CPR1]
MLTGLQLMTPAELVEVARLTGVHPEESPEKIRSEVVKWIARRIQCSDSAPEVVERAALEKVARDFGLTVEPGISTDDLERNVRLKIATDAAEYLSPAWRLACALVAMGPPEAVPSKLKLLQKISSLAVPSSSTSQQLLQDWQAMCQKRPGEEELLDELKPAIAALRAGAYQHAPEKVENALTLALVISLADGRFSMEEERLFRSFGAMLGREPRHCDELLRRVNSLYWNHQMEASPTNPTVEADLAESQQAALKAAEMTLGSIGALEGLVMVARDKVIADKGGPTPEPAPLPAPKSGWGKLFGSLSGMKQFVQTRVATEDQSLLVRLIYLAIVRQHTQALVERDARALEAEQLAAQQQAEAVRAQAPPPEVAPAATAAAPRRAIKLDP